MYLIKEISRSPGTRSFLLLAGKRCSFQVLLPCSCGKKTQQNEALCYTGSNKKEIYSEVNQTLYIKSMWYFSTAKFESRKECTAFIEIRSVSEGKQGKHKHSTKEFHSWSCSTFVRICLFFGCSKQTSDLCGGVSVFTIFVGSFTMLERR